MILVLDNYDSFVHNVARHLREVGGEGVVVVRSDAIDLRGIHALAPSHLVVSPGPCTPDESGISVAAVRAFAGKIPILGICLGHQAVAVAFGGALTRSGRPIHGRASLVHHTGAGILAGLPRPFPAGRYHSLTVDSASVPPELLVAARSDGEIMALHHERWAIWGLQFHPESILTPMGNQIFRKFVDMRETAPVSATAFDPAVMGPAPVMAPSDA